MGSFLISFVQVDFCLQSLNSASLQYAFGLGVMGRNLVLNLADHGCAVAGYDQNQAKVEALRQESKERGSVHVGSFGGLIFPDLSFRLEPVLNRVAFAAALPLI